MSSEIQFDMGKARENWEAFKRESTRKSNKTTAPLFENMEKVKQIAVRLHGDVLFSVIQRETMTSHVSIKRVREWMEKPEADGYLREWGILE